MLREPGRRGSSSAAAATSDVVVEDIYVCLRCVSVEAPGSSSMVEWFVCFVHQDASYGRAIGNANEFNRATTASGPATVRH